jgi:hypothetical protein
MITIKNLTKIFRTEELETSALSGINLQINEGGIFGSVGLRENQHCSILLGYWIVLQAGVIPVEPGNDWAKRKHVLVFVGISIYFFRILTLSTSFRFMIISNYR